MKRFFRIPKSVGQAPGTLVPTPQVIENPLKLTLFEYGSGAPGREREVETVDDFFPFDPKYPVSWLSVDGSQQAEFLEELGSKLNIHPLVMEDILDTSQRPNIEDYDRYLFIELNMLLWDEDQDQVALEQVSILLGPNYVITFQEFEKDVFDPIRKRIREGASRLHKHGADYLTYTLIDVIIDHYFVVLENLGEKIERLEERLIQSPDPETMHSIQELKREIIFLRKSIWPLREVISELERGETTLFQKSSLIYMRDLYDHTIQIIDIVETFRDMISGMLDVYLSSISNRMNEIMKVLTIISTVFIPLSFIVGLYGMNFENMPELNWKWGYLGVWVVIISVVIGMLIYFRRKKWL